MRKQRLSVLTPSPALRGGAAVPTSPVQGAVLPPWQLVITVLLLLLTFAVRLRTFAPLEVGIDGALSMDLAMSPVGQILDFNAQDVHPPLFYLALKGWFWLVDPGYYTAKYLTILASVLGVAVLVALGRRLVHPHAGWLAGVLLLLSPAAVLLGPAVRDYTSGLALSLLTLLLTLLVTGDGWRGHNRPLALALAGLAVVSGAALVTWYFQWVILAVCGVIALRRFVPVVGALLIGMVLASPWYVYAVPRVLQKVSTGTTGYGGQPAAPSLAAMLPPLAHSLTGGDSSPVLVDVSMALWAVLALLGCLALFWMQRSRQLGTDARALPVLLGAWLASMVFVYVVVARWYLPSDAGRYALLVVPFAALLQAAAVWRGFLPVRLVSALGVVVLLGWNTASWHQLVTSPPIDWANDPGIAYVSEHLAPGDAVLFSDRARRLRFALELPSVTTGVVHTAGQRYFLPLAPAAVTRTLQRVLPSANRIWYLESNEPPNTPPLLRQQLVKVAYPAQRQNIAGTDVQLYLNGLPGINTTPRASFGTLAQLTNANYDGVVQPGGGIRVALTWQCVTPSTTPYTVFLHLEDMHGNLMAQHDSQPQDGFAPTPTWKAGEVVLDHAGIPLPDQLPTGAYRLYAGLYNGNTRLTLPDGSNQLLVGLVQVN